MDYHFNNPPKTFHDGMSYNEDALLIVRKENGSEIHIPISIPPKGSSKLVRNRIRELIHMALLDNGVTWDEMRITAIECRPGFCMDTMCHDHFYYTLYIGPIEQFCAGFQGYVGGSWRSVPIGKSSRLYYEGFFPRYVYMRGGHMNSFIDETKCYEEEE